jgi:hypothetical protein
MSDWAEYQKLGNEAFLLTLKSVCKALQEQGITSVEMAYSGGGDSGDYEHPVFMREGEDVSPDGSVERFRLHRKWDFEKALWINTGIEKSTATLEDAAFDLMVDAVRIRHSGWEINEGGEGTVTLDVPLGVVTVNHGSHYISTEWDEYSLCAEGGEE